VIICIVLISLCILGKIFICSVLSQQNMIMKVYNERALEHRRTMAAVQGQSYWQRRSAVGDEAAAVLAQPPPELQPQALVPNLLGSRPRSVQPLRPVAPKRRAVGSSFSLSSLQGGGSSPLSPSPSWASPPPVASVGGPSLSVSKKLIYIFICYLSVI